MVDKKKLLIATDFNMDGSGYQTICEGLGIGLSKYYDILVLGLQYDGRQHNYPFRVTPTHYEWLPQHIVTVSKELKADWVLLALDIPKIVSLLLNIKKNAREEFLKINFAGVFPVESSPISRGWDKGLAYLGARFTFTSMGAILLEGKGLPTNKLAVGVNPIWYDAAEKPKFEVKEGTEYILTVAENQIRKNIPQAMSIVGKFIAKHPEKEMNWILLTNDAESKDGWGLRSDDSVYTRTGISPDRVIILEKSRQGVTRDIMRDLYRNAKCLLLTSHAEGIGLPLYEAQACGCPVLMTEKTGGAEAIVKGLTIAVDGSPTIFPWGNNDHYWIDEEDALEKLERIVIRQEFNRDPIKFPTWEVASDKIAIVLESIGEALKHVEELKQ